MVLSDELLKEYFRFENGENCDKRVIEQLLRLYKPVIITNKAQYARIGKELNRKLNHVLTVNKLKSQSLEELASKTTHKIILDTIRNDFPFVNINNDVIESNLTSSLDRNDSRAKSILHIKALCESAKNIYIYDKYFNSNGDRNIEVLKQIFPQKKLAIWFGQTLIENRLTRNLGQYCADWEIQTTVMKSYHDRYIVIDDKIEILLSSGFHYLANIENDLTYVVREVSKNRLLL